MNASAVKARSRRELAIEENFMLVVLFRYDVCDLSMDLFVMVGWIRYDRIFGKSAVFFTTNYKKMKHRLTLASFVSTYHPYQNEGGPLETKMDQTEGQKHRNEGSTNYVIFNFARNIATNEIFTRIFTWDARSSIMWRGFFSPSLGWLVGQSVVRMDECVMCVQTECTHEACFKEKNINFFMFLSRQRKQATLMLLRK